VVRARHPAAALPPGRFPKDLRERAAEEEDELGEPHFRFLVTACGSQWQQRCHAPDCLETCASMNRKFQARGICRTAAYCSRRCQKVAWGHPVAPHRKTICTLLHRVHLLQQKWLDGLRVRKEFEKAISKDLAQAGCVIISDLVRLESLRLGEECSLGRWRPG
jgi:hypothetical protein